MTFNPRGQNARRLAQPLLWALFLVAAAADNGDTGNGSKTAPPPNPNPPRQRPQVIYRPHGIEIKMPTAPFPARRNWPRGQGRPQSFGQPAEVPMALDPWRPSQVKGPEFPPRYQGPRGYVGPQRGSAPFPPPRQHFDPRLRQIPGPQFPPGYQGPRYPGPDQAFSPPLGIMQDFNHLPHPGSQVPPGYRGPYYPGLGQAFSPRLGIMQGFNSSSLPQIPGPQLPNDYRGLRSEPQVHPPMDPWFGLPDPTPMGPYSHRRPLQPSPVNFEPQRPLPPLRDLVGHKPRNAVNSSELEEWQPDTWQGAQAGRIVRPPAPGDLRALVPPYLRVRGAAAGDAPPSEEVGYVDAPEQDTGEDGEQGMQYSEEKDYVTPESTPRPTPSPQYSARGLAPASLASAPPPLLGDDAMIEDDAAPLDDALSSDDAEWFINKAADNRQDAEWFSDEPPDELPASHRRSDTFDNLLLL